MKDICCMNCKKFSTAVSRYTMDAYHYCKKNHLTVEQIANDPFISCENFEEVK